MSRRQGTPLLVRKGVGTPLPTAPQQGENAFNEDFVQRLLFDHPECLPFHEIEPGLGRFRSVCREMPTKHGPIDNVFMTANWEMAEATVVNRSYFSVE